MARKTRAKNTKIGLMILEEDTISGAEPARMGMEYPMEKRYVDWCATRDLGISYIQRGADRSSSLGFSLGTTMTENYWPTRSN